MKTIIQRIIAMLFLLVTLNVHAEQNALTKHHLQLVIINTTQDNLLIKSTTFDGIKVIYWKGPSVASSDANLGTYVATNTYGSMQTTIATTEGDGCYVDLTAPANEKNEWRAGAYTKAGLVKCELTLVSHLHHVPLYILKISKY